MRATCTSVTFVRGLAASLMFAALACQDSLAPTDVAGTYVLQSVATEPLPAEIYRNDYVTIRVIADTLRLRPDGTGTMSGVQVAEPRQEGMAPATPAWWTGQLRFRIVEGDVEVTMICPPDANCVPGPHLTARRLDSGLRVDYALGGRVPRVYARIPKR
jgi:hypothetical protein